VVNVPRVWILIWVILGHAVPARAQCPDGSPPPCRPRPGPTGPLLTSVAVLTFENRSRDTSDAFLSEGLPDEITTRLAQLGRLVVTSRAQVRRLRRAGEMRIPDIGVALNAGYLVSGSVQRTGSRLRVNVELLRSNTARQIWGYLYDRGRDDLLEVQSEVALAVAGAITGQLQPQERRILAGRPTTSREAYELYLRGNANLERRQVPSFAYAAVQFYEQAVTLDSSFAEAWAALAVGDAWLVRYGIDTTLDAVARAGVARNRARQLAPGQVASHMAAGYYAMWVISEYAEAQQEFAAALQRDSLNPGLLVALAAAEARLEQWTGAIAHYQHALELDPRDVEAARALGLTFALLKQFVEAKRFLDRAIALAPDDPELCFLRAWLAVLETGDLDTMRVYAARGVSRLGMTSLLDAYNPAIYALIRLDTLVAASIDHLERPPYYRSEFWLMKAWRAQQLGRFEVAASYLDSVRVERESHSGPAGPMPAMWLAMAYAGLGRDADALRVSDSAVALAGTQTLLPRAAFTLFHAQTLAAAGRVEEGITLLESLVDQPGYVTRALLRVDAAFAPFRDHPRFQRLIAVN